MQPAIASGAPDNSMDSTSLARLAALKRRLPPGLSLPEQKPVHPQPTGRHPLETTRNPEQLFAELMNASPDGRVPDHLLKRLQSLEQQRTEATGGQAMDKDLPYEQQQYSLFEALLGEDEDV